jgi:predicted ester cyclase
MSTEHNKAMTQVVWGDIFNGGKVERISEFFASDYVYHGPGSYEMKGTEQLKKFVIWIRTALNNVHFDVEDLIAEGDKVVSIWTMKATKDNKPITLKGVVVSRISEDKCVEDFEVFDRLAMAEQGTPNWFAKRMINSIAKQLVKGKP